jgi:hypothetical protein
MEPRLQRRLQRSGWDLAAAAYEPLWRAQLAPGERVLDVARSACPMPASMSRCALSASCTCQIPGGRCARFGACFARELAWSSPCGANDRDADGRRS